LIPIAWYLEARLGDCSQTPIGKKSGSLGNPFTSDSPADTEQPKGENTPTIIQMAALRFVLRKADRNLSSNRNILIDLTRHFSGVAYSEGE
jgi:hypothetical protein